MTLVLSRGIERKKKSSRISWKSFSETAKEGKEVAFDGQVGRKWQLTGEIRYRKRCGHHPN